jgi:cytidylate kinase
MPADSNIAKLVEKQMRNWEIARQQRLEVERGRPETAMADFVTVSRAVGSRGTEVAQALAQRLDWPLFDKEILQHMARDDRLRAQLYENMDERDTSWIESVAQWLLHGELRHDDYFHRLTETVLALARQGPAVFLGRGVDFFLPQDRGLRVRFLAPEELRVREFARQNQCDEKTARAEIERIERERVDFIRRHFGKAKADPTRFDLLINLGRVSEDDAVELILAALRLRGASVV